MSEKLEIAVHPQTNFYPVPVKESPVDDDYVKAFIAGWNAAKCTDYDFDMALHWWMRGHCGIL